MRASRGKIFLWRFQEHTPSRHSATLRKLNELRRELKDKDVAISYLRSELINAKLAPADGGRARQHQVSALERELLGTDDVRSDSGVFVRGLRPCVREVLQHSCTSLMRIKGKMKL